MRLQTPGPSPETWTWLVCSGPEESCSSQCQEALGFHPSLGSNFSVWRNPSSSLSLSVPIRKMRPLDC